MEHFIVSASLLGLLTAIGLLLGQARPTLGIVGLLVCVVPASSLAWHLGLPNLPTTTFFTVGLCAGFFLRGSVRPSPREDRPVIGSAPHPILTGSARVLGFCILASSGAAMLRFYRQAPDIFWRSVASTLSSAGLSVSGMAASPMHHMMVPLLGLAVFVIVRSLVRERSNEKRIQLACLAGGWVTVGSALAKIPLGLVHVARPDKDLSAGSGWIAFFQDPHALAAYLVLVIGLSSGVALGPDSRRVLRRVGAGVLVLASGWLLLMTGSRTGIASGAVACWAAAALSGFLPGRWSARRVATTMLAVGIPSVMLTTLVNDPLRETAAGVVGRLGASQAAEGLRSPGGALASASLESRIFFWQHALEVASARPVLGAGPGGLARSSSLAVDAPIAEIPSPWLNENAHNHFLQLAAEFGWPAAISFSILWIGVLATLLRSAFERRGPEGGNDWVRGSAAGLFAFTIMLVTAHPLMLVELQVFVASLIALALPRRESSPRTHSRRWKAAGAALLAVVLVVAVRVLPATARAGPSSEWSWGVYGWEDTRVKPTTRLERYRWTSGAARFGLVPDERFLVLPLYVERPVEPGEGVRLFVTLDGVPVDDLVVGRSPYRELLAYDLDALRSLAGSPTSAREPLAIGVDVPQTFVPAEYGPSTDHRRLGVKLGPAGSTPGIPERGVGVYPWEREPESRRRYRWTRRMASIPVSVDEGEMRFQIKADHPGISGGDPVVITFFWNGEPTLRRELTDNDWETVHIRPPAHARVGFLTVHVSRVWSPAESGVSPDDRYLGIAMTPIH